MATTKTDTRGDAGWARLGTLPPASFFRRPALELAPDLLGLVLCHRTARGLLAGRIVEVEAYCGPEDLAAHSARGRRTPRNEVMYGPGGRAYVYFVYGMHFCVNVVAATAEVPQAVLIRAAQPTHGIALMAANRGRGASDLSPRAVAGLARGPGNLARAFAIDRSQNGLDLRRSDLRLLVPRRAAPQADDSAATSEVIASRRIGVDYAGEWARRPWRFSLRDHPCVSRPPR